MEDGDVRGKEECETKIYENIMPLIQNTIVLSDIKLTLRFVETTEENVIKCACLKSFSVSQ